MLLVQKDVMRVYYLTDEGRNTAFHKPMGTLKTNKNNKMYKTRLKPVPTASLVQSNDDQCWLTLTNP